MKSAKAAINRAGMDAFTHQFFSDMFLESGDLELRGRVIARAEALIARFREDLFLDLVRWDATKLRNVLDGLASRHSCLQSTYVNSRSRALYLFHWA